MSGFCRSAVAALIVAFAVATPASARAEARTGRLEVAAGHSRLVDLPAPLKRVSVADETVADVLVINPRQIYVNGRKPGNTNITVWDRAERVIAAYAVGVGRDYTRLKAAFARVLPGEAIEVHELEGALVLAGSVSSESAREKAESIARLFEKERVSNLLEVVDQKQVLLKLRFAEVNRQAARRMNVNLGYWDPARPGNIFFTFLDNMTGPPSIDYSKGAIEFDLSANVGAWGGLNDSGRQYMAFLDILKQNGLAKILAEPNLVCVSGKKANFLAGGEFPIPVPGRDYTAIVFKKYGVQLTFLPKVLPNGKISLEVEPEVSELDYSPGVVTDGFVVPGLTTRRASTQLELGDGQGFAIAGLLKQDVTRSVSKWPFLGDLPILGALFRSSQYRNRETELLIVVTPHIVRPGDKTPDPLIGPRDFDDPDDMDFYLWGKTGGDDEPPGRAGAKAERSMEMEGRFGHEVAF